GGRARGGGGGAKGLPKVTRPLTPTLSPMGRGSTPSLRLAPRSIASHHRTGCMSVTDQQACADVIQAWSFARDQGRWSDLLATFAPEGQIAVSWFRGPFEKFVERCRQSFAAGVRSK